ncbi:hypothetical protein NUW58_g1937 [Xylaria curta]|uniref:Uncharacterized protein n=1 Tax=Xylaria curta TaxID=42375 RepID=A0ACC1PKH2_9PEZI|nr:hypothetical protein NUW58_g1937 [Xylaria curta]
MANLPNTAGEPGTGSLRRTVVEQEERTAAVQLWSGYLDRNEGVFWDGRVAEEGGGGGRGPETSGGSNWSDKDEDARTRRGKDGYEWDATGLYSIHGTTGSHGVCVVHT